MALAAEKEKVNQLQTRVNALEHEVSATPRSRRECADLLNLLSSMKECPRLGPRSEPFPTLAAT